MSSPFIATLFQNKLIRNNYVEWKLDLDKLLIVEELKYVLIFSYPPIPNYETPTISADQYWQWLKDDEKACCYILDSMSDMLKHQHQSFNIASAIMLNLKDMFRD